MTEVPWVIMVKENNCIECDRMHNCTYKDLVLCFMSNVDHVVSMSKKEAEELKQN